MSDSSPKTAGFWFAAAATVLVLAALVAGALVVGSPGEARMERLDEARRADLQDVERALWRTWSRGHPIPSAYGELAAMANMQRDELADPVTGDPYEYRALSDTSAEVCATFALAHTRLNPYANGSAIDQHPAGRACFTLTPNP